MPTLPPLDPMKSFMESLVTALAVDDHVIQEILQVVKQSEPRTRLPHHPSPFWVLPSIYQMFFRAPPLNARIGAICTDIVDWFPTPQLWNIVE